MRSKPKTATPDPAPELQSSDWWRSRRRQYNIGLIFAGITAFLAYCIVLAIFDPITRDTQDIEFATFTLLFQSIAYLLFMGIANIFYCLGPLLERWLHPKNPGQYRRSAFAFGFWISARRPFSFLRFLLFSPYSTHNSSANEPEAPIDALERTAPLGVFKALNASPVP